MKTIYKKLLYLFLLVLFPTSILAQNTIEGIVVDAKNNQPIPGVNVNIQGTTNGTSSDMDGKFKLSKISKGDKLVFSFIGYKNETISYNNQKSLTVKLDEESNKLDEVVVQVGYGSVKKKDATGSVSLLTSKDFNKGAIVSTDQLLAGKVAGVRITSDGGNPDSDTTIRIRGGASISASNKPLIIIDGVPIGDLNPAGVSNPLSLINPNDVESFSVLKDASATAIYGIRASNGVIIITTKKGSSGKPEYTFSSKISIGKVGKKLDVMNSSDFVKFIQQYKSDKTNLLGIDDPNSIAVDNLSTPEVEGRIIYNTDWQDVILRTAISSDNNFSARANLFKKIPFRASIGYSKIDGLIKTSDYERFSYSIKMTPKLLKDNLKIDINAKGTYTDKNSINQDGALGGALSMDPTKPVYGASFNNKFVGYYQNTLINSNQDQKIGATNPLAILEQRIKPERALRFLGNVELEYKLPFLKALRAVVNMGLDASTARIFERFSENALETYGFDQSNTNPNTNYLFNPGVNFIENQTATNKNLDAYLVYSKNLSGFVSKFDVQGGYSYQDFVTDGNKQSYYYDQASGTRIPVINPNDPNQRYYSPLNLQAFFARTNFDILNKYLFTGTLRADATSRFRGENRWGYFPAFGAAWKIKEEFFLKNSNFVKDLKLRLGWGKTGQAEIGNFFPTRQLFEPGDVNSQYLPDVTTYSSKQYDAGLSWEKTTTNNIGLDFEIFKSGFLTGSLDVYKRKTNDLIAIVPLKAGSTGGSEFYQNVGSLDSEGFELNLNVKLINTKKISLSTGGNIAYNYSTVTNLKGVTSIDATETGITGTGVRLARYVVGAQPFSAWVFEQLYDSNGQPIVGAYKDLNGDNKINNEDRYNKSLRPNWTFGFNTNVSYANWDLTANFRGQIGGQVYNLKKAEYGTRSSAIPQNGNSFNNVLNFNNGSANILFDNYNGNAQFSDYLLEDASFLRCDNISLGYKLPKFVNNASLRLMLAVNNAFIVSKYSGQDPENFNAIDRNLYPRPVTYTFGLTLDF